jgi:hypothetical protein
MPSQNITDLLHQAELLSAEEREQFLKLLQAQRKPGQSRSQRDFIAERLYERGIIRKVPRKLSPQEIAAFNRWKPIKLPGKPVSQSIIEERR